MAVLALQRIVNFETTKCCSCGVEFALTEYFEKERRKDHALFYCPNGHSQYFASETDAERFKRERDAANKAKAEATEKMWAAQAAQRKAEEKARKLAKRASAGVCPCCNRTVSQMARHMKTKHPGYVETSEVSQ